MNSVGEIRLAGAAGMAFSVVFFVYLILRPRPPSHVRDIGAGPHPSPSSRSA